MYAHTNKINNSATIMNVNATQNDRFWPKSDIHYVHSIKLDEHLSNFGDIDSRYVNKLCRIADSIRSLQCADVDDSIDEEIQRLKNISAKLMKKLAGTIWDSDSAQALLLRASVLDGSSLQNAIQSILSFNENQVVSFCGDLSTWHGKSNKLFYSSFFAAVDTESDKSVRTLDSKINNGINYIQQIIGCQLQIAAPLQFKICNLIDCGGEANLYPKHFSYFFPEDEGIKYSTIKKTIVFKNVYTQIHRKISETLAHQIIHSEDRFCTVNAEQLTNHLLTWFRGHDIAHGISAGQTNYLLLRKFGRWFSMECQEVLADCFGFLFALSDEWQNHMSLRTDIQCQIFTAELVRYLKRGCSLYPDSGAAFIELSYLYKYGFVQIDFDKSIITTSNNNIINGFTALAKTLYDTILTNNERKIYEFYNSFSWEANKEFLKDIMNSFCTVSHVTDY